MVVVAVEPWVYYSVAMVKAVGSVGERQSARGEGNFLAQNFADIIACAGVVVRLVGEQDFGLALIFKHLRQPAGGGGFAGAVQAFDDDEVFQFRGRLRMVDRSGRSL